MGRKLRWGVSETALFASKSALFTSKHPILQAKTALFASKSPILRTGGFPWGGPSGRVAHIVSKSASSQQKALDKPKSEGLSQHSAALIRASRVSRGEPGRAGATRRAALRGPFDTIRLVSPRGALRYDPSRIAPRGITIRSVSYRPAGTPRGLARFLQLQKPCQPRGGPSGTAPRGPPLGDWHDSCNCKNRANPAGRNDTDSTIFSRAVGTKLAIAKTVPTPRGVDVGFSIQFSQPPEDSTFPRGCNRRRVT